MSLLKIDDKIIIINRIVAGWICIKPGVNPKDIENFISNIDKELECYLYSNDNILGLKVKFFKFFKHSTDDNNYIALDFDINKIIVENVHFEGFQYHTSIFTPKDFAYVKNLKKINKFGI